MKRLAIAAVVLAVVAVANLAQGADDPTGTWTWSTFNNRTMTLKLKLEGEKLSGSVVWETQDKEIEEPAFKDNVISFTITSEVGGVKRVTKYKGKLSGDTIKGTKGTDRNGQAASNEWEAKRQK